MADRKDILDELATILDPEMPINLVDLGLIERVNLLADDKGESARVEIDVLPTFVGCPALDMIRDQIIERVGRLPGVAEVKVRFLHDPPWSTDRISPAGREALRGHGVTVPPRGAGGTCGTDGSADTLPRPVPLTISAAAGGEPTAESVACPFCDALDTERESRFGPTRCRMIYYCHACRNSFEHMKHV